jgi:osmotically inducible protein OsmC
MQKRKATAVWSGGLKDGKGKLTTESKALNETPYDFRMRFESAPNPEELIGAAHAGCFSMAFSGKLGEAGMTPESIRTIATVSLDKTDAGPTVTAIHLEVSARVPGADRAKFEKAANEAKATCPISRLLSAAATITMEAKLEEGAPVR